MPLPLTLAVLLICWGRSSIARSLASRLLHPVRLLCCRVNCSRIMKGQTRDFKETALGLSRRPSRFSATQEQEFRFRKAPQRHHEAFQADTAVSRFALTMLFRQAHMRTVITPDTGLDELSTFFEQNAFAIITDESRKFVLGVVVPDDLHKFASRFAPQRTPSPSNATVTGK
jgi:hypothetical protein